MDPFLSGITDHTRQESADSGLSLSSNHYSVSHTPDLLATMDDSMDCISGQYQYNWMATEFSTEISICMLRVRFEFYIVEIDKCPVSHYN